MKYYVKSNPWSGITEFDTAEQAMCFVQSLVARGYSVHIYPMPA